MVLRGAAGQALRALWIVSATSVLGVLAGLFLIYESVVTGPLRLGITMEWDLTRLPGEVISAPHPHSNEKTGYSSYPGDGGDGCGNPIHVCEKT